MQEKNTTNVMSFSWWTLGEPAVAKAMAGHARTPAAELVDSFATGQAPCGYSSSPQHLTKQKPQPKLESLFGGPWENRTPARRMQTGCTTTMLKAHMKSRIMNMES